MNFLLDTHILLWSAVESPKLSQDAIAILNSPDHELWFSVLSLWEVALKRSRTRKDFGLDVVPLRTGLLSNGYQELPIEAHHVAAVIELPMIHTDPFDRLLIAQAKAEGMVLLTADRDLSRYDGPIRLV